MNTGVECKEIYVYLLEIRELSVVMRMHYSEMVRKSYAWSRFCRYVEELTWRTPLVQYGRVRAILRIFLSLANSEHSSS